MNGVFVKELESEAGGTGELAWDRWQMRRSGDNTESRPLLNLTQPSNTNALVDREW